MPHFVIAKNTLFQLIARIATSSAAFITTIAIARYYGTSGYGDFTKITAFVGLFYLLADFGLNALYLQEDQKVEKFRSFLYGRILISIFLVLVVNSISFLLPYNEHLGLGFSPMLRFGIFLFSLTLITYSVITTASAVYQKKLRYADFMTANILGSIITLVSVLTFIFFSLPLSVVFVGFVLGAITTTYFSLVFTKEKIVPVVMDTLFLKKLFVKSIPLGLMLIFNVIYFRADIIILSLLKSSADVGIYGLAYKFFDFFIALPLFLSNSLYPLLLKHKDNNVVFERLVRKYFVVFIGLSFLIVIPSWFFSPLFSFIKSDFILSVLPFRILLLSVPFFFATNFLQWVLITKQKQGYLLKVYFVTTVLNIVLNIIFIPLASYMASAIITGVLEAVVFVLLMLKIFRLQKSYTK